MDLSIKNLAKKNCKRNPFRSSSLIFIVGVLTFTLFFSSYTMFSLKNGMSSLRARMGADIIVVPEGEEMSMQGALLTGEPSTFYLDEKILDEIDDPNIESMTKQVYVATLAAGCCAFPIQSIGIDFETDFVVKPWLEKNFSGSLGKREILVGSNIMAAPDSTLKFFNQDYLVKEKLERTGMGFDNSIFLSMDDAREMAKLSNEIVPNKGYNDGVISNVLIKVKDARPRDVSIQVNKKVKDYGATSVIAASMLSDTSEKLNGLLKYIYILLAVVWMLSLAIITILFQYNVNERKEEYATLRAIGANKNHLKKLVSMESLYISAAGAISGTGLSIAVCFLFDAWIKSIFSLPFLTPNLPGVLIMATLSVAVGCIIGPVAASTRVKKISEGEIAFFRGE